MSLLGARTVKACTQEAVLILRKILTLTSHKINNEFNNPTCCENGKISNLKQT